MYNMKFDPRENQYPILKFLYNYIQESGSIRGILQAAPGTGKTFMSIYFAKMFNKTLVIVPKNILADQWKQEFLNFTDLKEDEISILQGSNINEIKEALKAKVIITKPQSLLSQLKNANINDLIDVYSEIDFVIYDECHGAGALGFSKTTSLFRTCNVLGLSATPFRKDINKFLLDSSIGEVLIEADAEVLTPDIYIQKLPNSYIEFNDKEIFALRQRLNDYPQMLALFNMYLSLKPDYLTHLAEWVKWSIDNNHNSVVLFSTNKLANKQAKILEILHSHLKDDILVLTGNSKNDAIKIAKDENKILREKLKEYKEELNQKVKNKEIKRKDADALYKEERQRLKIIQEANINNAIELYHRRIKEAKIIISNFGLLREGFDKPELSFVIFGSPIIGRITIIQTLGRVTRLHEGKQKPIALFPMTEAFETLNKSVYTIIRNNIKGVYKDANIKFV